MSTFLWVMAAVLSVAALLGSGMVRGASRIAGLAWWGGIFTMIAIWHWWAYRGVVG